MKWNFILIKRNLMWETSNLLEEFSRALGTNSFKKEKRITNPYLVSIFYNLFNLNVMQYITYRRIFVLLIENYLLAIILTFSLKERHEKWHEFSKVSAHFKQNNFVLFGYYIKEQEEQAKTSDCLSETHRKKQSPSHQSKEKVLGQLW